MAGVWRSWRSQTGAVVLFQFECRYCGSFLFGVVAFLVGLDCFFFPGVVFSLLPPCAVLFLRLSISAAGRVSEPFYFFCCKTCLSFQYKLGLVVFSLKKTIKMGLNFYLTSYHARMGHIDL
jgi:hypothetical protein